MPSQNDTSPSSIQQPADEAVALSKNPVSFLTLGLKLLIGVALVSNLCIGTLMVVNWQANQEVTQKNEALAKLRDTLSDNLREEIVHLQDKYLQIPQYLEVDPTKDILNWIKKNHPVKSEQVIEGRSNYKSFFSRTQRRDIGNGRFVVHVMDGTLMLSAGVMDEQGEFKDAVKMLSLTSDSPDQDKEIVNSKIEKMNSADNSDALKQNIASLIGLLADEAIEAEKTRNEIVQFVEGIAKEDEAIKLFGEEKQRLTFYIAAATVILNLVVLYLLTWFIVEKPLRKLYRVIQRIQEGQETRIPYQKRRDKVGVLARTIKSFKDALDNLKKEDLRKQQEQRMIQELIRRMTEMIHDLQTRSTEMSHAASTLHDLAVRTEAESTSVNESSTQTAERTDAVSEAAHRLKLAVDNIGNQIDTQKALMEKITAVAVDSRENMRALDSASKEIVSIIQIVKDISSQTKLLALNANIEASRAGASGKGFIVVASEIRELSNQTEAATGEIAEKIGGIQKASNNIIDSIQSIERRVDSLAHSSSQIHGAVSQQQSATSDIAHNADLTSHETQDVSRRIHEVKEVAEQTRDLSSQVHKDSQKLSNGLEELLNEAMQKLSGVGLSGDQIVCIDTAIKKGRQRGRRVEMVKACVANLEQEEDGKIARAA